MPVIGKAMTTQGGIQFSAAKLETLTASNYTLGGIAVDTTGSVEDFVQALEDMLKVSVEGCRKNPRKDHMLVRTIEFNSTLSDDVRELNGFEPVLSIDPDSYKGRIKPDGGTPLFKATYNLIASIKEQGKILIGEGYNVNGIAFIITDGDNNTSTQYTPEMIKDLIASIRREEALESFVSILIGVNVTDPRMKAALARFHTEAGLTHFMEVKDVTAAGLAKVGGFISRSFSSTSQAIGTGGPSQAVAPGQSLTI